MNEHDPHEDVPQLCSYPSEVGKSLVQSSAPVRLAASHAVGWPRGESCSPLRFDITSRPSRREDLHLQDFERARHTKRVNDLRSLPCLSTGRTTYGSLWAKIRCPRSLER